MQRDRKKPQERRQAPNQQMLLNRYLPQRLRPSVQRARWLAFPCGYRLGTVRKVRGEPVYKTELQIPVCRGSYSGSEGHILLRRKSRVKKKAPFSALRARSRILMSSGAGQVAAFGFLQGNPSLDDICMSF
jgi:hypothetical protein